MIQPTPLVNTSEWNDYVDAWFNLREFYDSQGGTIISPIALKQYLEFTILLRKLLLSDDLEQSRNEDITEALLFLEHVMTEIVTYGITNLREEYPNLKI